MKFKAIIYDDDKLKKGLFELSKNYPKAYERFVITAGEHGLIEHPITTQYVITSKTDEYDVPLYFSKDAIDADLEMWQIGFYMAYVFDTYGEAHKQFKEILKDNEFFGILEIKKIYLEVAKYENKENKNGKESN